VRVLRYPIGFKRFYRVRSGAIPNPPRSKSVSQQVYTKFRTHGYYQKILLPKNITKKIITKNYYKKPLTPSQVQAYLVGILNYGGVVMDCWWEDLDLMRRLFRYDCKTGLIYAQDRLSEDFYDTGEGSSYQSASGAASKYNKDRSGRLSFNRRVKTERSTCYYLTGGVSYRGVDKKLLAHRVAFFLYHGHYPIWPNSVDHINRDGCDNRIENLREVTAREQSANTGIGKANTSGVKGVSFLKDRGKWRASININGRKTNLGTFFDISDAISARKLAEVTVND